LEIGAFYFKSSANEFIAKNEKIHKEKFIDKNFEKI